MFFFVGKGNNKLDSKTRSPLLHKLFIKNQMNKTMEEIPESRKPFIRTRRKSDSYQPEFQNEIDCCNQTPSFEFSRGSSGRGVYLGDEMVKFFRKKNLKWKDITKNLIDTHCHFDMLFSKLVFKGFRY